MDRGIVLWTVALALLAVAVGSAGIAGAVDPAESERSLEHQVAAGASGDGLHVVPGGRGDDRGSTVRWHGRGTANGTPTEPPSPGRATPDSGSDPLGPVPLLLVVGAVGGVVGAGLLIASNE